MRSVLAIIGSTMLLAPSATDRRVATPQTKDLVFATTEHGDLKLDLYMPQEGTENPPLVVFIHGGGWRNNSYKKCLTPWLADYGFAVASVGYRLVDKAVYPAQIHDVKAAVQWLRANAPKYGYDARRIGVAGTSAGGHLAMLLGVTHGSAEHEGSVGDHGDQSTRVHAVIDYYGPSDFLQRAVTQPHKTEKPGSVVWGLLGGPVSKNRALARLASPAFHVTPDDPPMLIIHGTEDKTVLYGQAERMIAEYRKCGLVVRHLPVKGGGHGGEVYFKEPYRKPVVEFLNKHLRGK